MDQIMGEMAKRGTLEDKIADVLADFAVVLMEELAKELGLGWEVEAKVMERISPILNRFRRGESLDPSEACKRGE